MAHQAVAVALASFKKLCSAASLVSMSAISADASPCFAIGGLTSAFAGLASAFSLPAMSASLFLTSRRILPGDDATALVLSAFFLARCIGAGDAAPLPKPLRAGDAPLEFPPPGV